ncbi:MAG: hypothetical protein NT067_00210 [Candidatus Diapherotrites archaeon]|nr:hypothetical protein [Candidatus Diapherotrites archaeon]
MFGRKRKELEVMWVAHGVAVKEEAELNEFFGVREDTVRPGATQRDRLVEHLNQVIQPGDKVLVEMEQEKVNELKISWAKDPLVPMSERFWRPVFEAIWQKGGNIVGIESPAGNRHANDLIMDRKFTRYGASPVLSNYESFRRENVIVFPLRERLMAKKTAREMEGTAPVRCAIMGAAHSVYLPSWLRSYGIKPKRWKYSLRASDGDRRAAMMGYYWNNERIREKRRKAKAGRKAKQRTARENARRDRVRRKAELREARQALRLQRTAKKPR